MMSKSQCQHSCGQKTEHADGSVKAHSGCQGHHDHAAHADMNTTSGRRKVGIACFITGGFMFVEAIGGVISGSLALLADAAHMLTDSASLALAWVGYWFATKKPDEKHSFGYSRVRVLAAFTNGIVLVALACWILMEGVFRLFDPPAVVSSTMLVISIGGFIVNLAAAYVLHGGSENDINLSGAYLHVLGDLLGSVAAIAAALAIFLTGWMIVDPLLSMLVALIILYAGSKFTMRAAHILIQGAPEDLTADGIYKNVSTRIEGVSEVQHIHAWMLTEDEPVVTIQVQVAEGYCPETLRLAIKEYLKKEMHAHTVTVEVCTSEIQEHYSLDNACANDDQFYREKKAG